MQVAAMAQIIIIYVDCELLRIRVDLKLLPRSRLPDTVSAGREG